MFYPDVFTFLLLSAKFTSLVHFVVHPLVHRPQLRQMFETMLNEIISWHLVDAIEEIQIFLFMLSLEMPLFDLENVLRNVSMQHPDVPKLVGVLASRS
jgi:hypothetical protein